MEEAMKVDQGCTHISALRRILDDQGLRVWSTRHEDEPRRVCVHCVRCKMIYETTLDARPGEEVP
jgi:hypothetical protein